MNTIETANTARETRFAIPSCSSSQSTIGCANNPKIASGTNIKALTIIEFSATTLNRAVPLNENIFESANVIAEKSVRLKITHPIITTNNV